MDSKKKKIIWGVIIILTIISLVIFIMSLFKAQLIDDIYSTDNQPVFETNSPEFEPVKIPAEASVEFTVENLSRNFADRFGSWSTDNQGQNLFELMSLSTNSFQNYLENVELDYQNEEFFGVTTRAISTKIISLDKAAGQAEILVKTQRTTTDDDLSQDTYYQEILISLIEINGTWLVDEAEWQES